MHYVKMSLLSLCLHNILRSGSYYQHSVVDVGALTRMYHQIVHHISHKAIRDNGQANNYYKECAIRISKNLED